MLPLDALGNPVNQSDISDITKTPDTAAIGKRKLGTLEVSSIGLGVQNMSRTYQTTVPSRTEMHNIIRKAYDNGVTLLTRQRRMGLLK